MFLVHNVLFIKLFFFVLTFKKARDDEKLSTLKSRNGDGSWQTISKCDISLGIKNGEIRIRHSNTSVEF